MEAKDERLKVTTEALSNPKMLKLYSWEDDFISRIQDKRQLELVHTKRFGRAVAWIASTSEFWPQMLPVVVFSTYIFAGNDLSLSVAVASMILFGQM